MSEDGKNKSNSSKLSIIRSHNRKLVIKEQKKLNNLAKPSENIRILRQKSLSKNSITPVQEENEGETELSLPQPQTLLGAGKTDPFSSYPIAGAPWIDQLISHCELFSFPKPWLEPTKFAGFHSRLGFWFSIIDVTIYQIAAANGRNNAYSYLLHDWVPLCMSNDLAFSSLLLYTEVGITKRHLYGANDTSPWQVWLYFHHVKNNERNSRQHPKTKTLISVK